MNTPYDASVNTDVEAFLRENPQLNEALQLFEISNEEYKKAVASYTNKPVITSSDSTDYYGDMAGNR